MTSDETAAGAAIIVTQTPALFNGPACTPSTPQHSCTVPKATQRTAAGVTQLHNVEPCVHTARAACKNMLAEAA